MRYDLLYDGDQFEISDKHINIAAELHSKIVPSDCELAEPNVHLVLLDLSDLQGVASRMIELQPKVYTLGEIDHFLWLNI